MVFIILKATNTWWPTDDAPNVAVDLIMMVVSVRKVMDYKDWNALSLRELRKKMC